MSASQANHSAPSRAALTPVPTRSSPATAEERCAALLLNLPFLPVPRAREPREPRDAHVLPVWWAAAGWRTTPPA